MISTIPLCAFPQTVLEADGPGDTYELINSVLAPGYDAVEEPDCNHMAFGRHIDEVFDSTLNKYVFRFHIHTSPDNDRCRNFDRQRNEIKTYDKSPDSLLAVENETVRYSWKFKLDSSFQASSSFTHLHQIKAVGGSESSMPQITLTARKGTPNRLELRYARDFTQTTKHVKDLDPLRGQWLEVEETITFGEIEQGSYEILITRFSNNDTLFSYQNDSIRMWKTNASFLRPKWGIYRSLNDSSSLKDETVLFADFSIEETNDPLSSIDDNLTQALDLPVYPNPAQDYLGFSDRVIEVCDRVSIYNLYGQLVYAKEISSKEISISHLVSGLYVVNLEKNDRRIQSVKILVE